MTSPNQAHPPSSPPIFRPWQLELPSTTSVQLQKAPVDGSRESHHSFFKTKSMEMSNSPSNTMINGMQKCLHNSSTTSASVKRPLENDVRNRVRKSQKLESEESEELNCVNLNVRDDTKYANTSVLTSNASAISSLCDYPPSSTSSNSGRGLPFLLPPFPFPSTFPHFNLVPGMERLQPLAVPLLGGLPNLGGLPDVERPIVRGLPGPTVLPTLDSLSGPLVPLMDVLVPASEVERVCAKRPRPKRFACSECGSAFSNKGQLKGHLRIHTGERPFACSHQGCGKKFTRNEELTRHRRIHSGARPFPCPFCDKRFGRKDHLKKHIRTHQRHTTTTTTTTTAAMVPPQPLLLHHLQRLQQLHHLH